MSMLAEPKKKIKWSINPRGNLWANDDSKLGQKLLEKMGWQKGKGLGRNENGRTNCISVVSKEDNKGVGWDDKIHNWVAHQDEFNALLQHLNKEHNTPSNFGNSSMMNSENSKKEVISLEVRSKTFKSRVHYKKFVSGKDVSQYSTEDMGCIFGKKLPSDAKYPIEDITSNKADTPKEDKDLECNGISTFTSSSNLSDYFAQKMKNKSQVLKKLDETLPGNEMKITFDASSKCENSSDEATTPLKRKAVDFELDDMEVAYKNHSPGLKGNMTSISEDVSLKKVEMAIFPYNHTQSKIVNSCKKAKKKEKTNLNSDDVGFEKKNSPTEDEDDPSNCDYYGQKNLSDNFEVNLECNNEGNFTSSFSSAEQNVKCKKNKKQRVDIAEVSDCTNKFIIQNEESKMSIFIPHASDIIVNHILEKNVDDCMKSKELENSTTNCDTNEQNIDSSVRTVAFGNVKLSKLEKLGTPEQCSTDGAPTVPKNSVQKSAKERLSDMLLLSKYSSLNKVPPSTDVFKNNMENWVATLKLARKQSRYKLLYQKFQEHPLLSTTNLSDIDGYGTTLDV